MRKHKVVLKDIVTVDFETYYANDFSLTNQAMNTSQYVRDPRFKVHCIGIKEGRKRAQWYDPDEGKKKLHSIDWSCHDWLSHNTEFDGLIASEHYGIVPRFYYDTLSQTRGLHSDVARAALRKIAETYGIARGDKKALGSVKGVRDLTEKQLCALGDMCAEDVDLCFEVFLFQLGVYPERELQLIDLAIRMFCAPVLMVDEKRAQKALGAELLEMDSLIASSGATKEELNSNPKFALKLQELGIDPPTKISNKTGAVNFAFAQTDPEFTDLKEHDDKRVVRLVEARLAAKSTLESTRAMRLMKAGENRQRLPVSIRYAAAKTLRFGGGNKMNLQNLPRAQKNVPGSGELRKSIIAPPGHEIVVGDSAQIEARLNDYTAGQEDALVQWRAYDAGDPLKDPYKILAAAIYGIDVADVDSDQRFIGKIAKLGLGFQMAALRYQTTLALGIMGPPVDVPLDMCQQVVDLYRKKSDKVVLQWKAAKQILTDICSGKSGNYKGFFDYEPSSIWLPSGMGIHYPGLHAIYNENGGISNFKYKSFDVWLKIYAGKLVENYIQALARIVVCDQMLVLAEKYRVVMMTHDEISLCVPKKQVERCKQDVSDEMKVPPSWALDLPLNSEVKSAVFYCK